MLVRAFFLLLLGANVVIADVTLYEWPYYNGRAYTLAANETSTANVPFRDSIQSIKLSDDVSLVTYDQADRRGANATWYRSVAYTGKWVKRIASLEVHNATALPTPPPGTIEAPWRFLGTWEGFMMVRFAAQSSQPECYAVNGVNCLLGKNVDDLLPLLAAYEGNRSSGNNDTSLSTFPAPCGAARREHWGSEGYSGSNEWCWAAKRRLQLFEARGSLARCVSGPLGIAAVRPSKDIPSCVCKAVQSWGPCRLFRDLPTCTASAERLLLEDGWISSGESYCRGSGSGESSCVTETSYGPSGSSVLSGMMAGVLTFTLFGALCGYYAKKKNQQMTTSRPAIEATVCSSKDGDEDDVDDGDFPDYRASNYVRDDRSDHH